MGARYHSAGAFNFKELVRFILRLIDICKKINFLLSVKFSKILHFLHSNFQELPICPRKKFPENFSTTKKSEFYADSNFFSGLKIKLPQKMYKQKTL